MAVRQRIGIGHDVHRFVTGRKLVLGGIEIPYEKGLEGWSDADALIHAIIDALLGASGMGDIGRHFPPGNPEYKGVSSLMLLVKVDSLMTRAGWQIGNIDTTIIAEQPRLSSYIEKMRTEISHTLRMPIDRINIKAGTSEGMGFTGRGEGIEVFAVALIENIE
jgi:2-C-methyl-D-erythritol 2,4-cyclodiphosphate synthase